MKILGLLAISMAALTLPANRNHEHGSQSAREELIVTVLFDNYSADPRLGTGWGFAALLETPGHTLLFDTGADGAVLLENMRLLAKDPLAIERVVISHAHGDHTGGLQALMDAGLRSPVVLLDAFPNEFEASLPEDIRVMKADPGMELIPGVRTTGQVGTAIPEQALILETLPGLVVLTGCAHPGVVEMVERALELVPDTPYLVAGGFHLGGASAEQVQGILGGFRRLGVEWVGPTHCTGDAAIEVFRDAYGEKYRPLGAGRVLRFPLPSSG